MSRWTRNPISDGSHERERRRIDLMRQLVETEKCRDIIRMGSEAFMLLCHKLRGTDNVKNRIVSFFFHCSGEIVSRHFHNVLRAIISLEDEFLVQPSGRDVPSQILHNNRYYPFFKVLMP
jgi:hypothetical protein